MALEQLSGGADPTPSIVDSGSTLAPSEGDSHSSCIGLSGEADCDLRGSGIKSDQLEESEEIGVLVDKETSKCVAYGGTNLTIYVLKKDCVVFVSIRKNQLPHKSSNFPSEKTVEN